jgi:ketosteroid isomerase-like protein
MNSAGRETFERAHEAWASGDFDRFVSCLDEDILYLVNVDGMQVPYAMSALGKSDAEQRLGLLVTVFAVEKFAVEKMVHEADHSWSRVHGVYRHRKTGEVLDTKLHFRAWFKNGLITRMEESLDARYVEAFERFVFYLQQHLEGKG